MSNHQALGPNHESHGKNEGCRCKTNIKPDIESVNVTFQQESGLTDFFSHSNMVYKRKQ